MGFDQNHLSKTLRDARRFVEMGELAMKMLCEDCVPRPHDLTLPQYQGRWDIQAIRASAESLLCDLSKIVVATEEPS